MTIRPFFPSSDGSTGFSGLDMRETINALLLRGAPINRKVAFLKDSYAARETTSTNNGKWNAVTTAGNRYLACGMMDWLRYMTYQAFDFDGMLSYGMVGQKTSEIAARLSALFAETDAATIVSGSSVNGILAINDGSVTAAACYAEEMAAADDIIARCAANGKYLYFQTPYTVGDSTAAGFTLVSQHRTRARIRKSLIRKYGSTPGVEIVDMDVGYADPTSGDGRALLGMVATNPRIHPAPMGAYASARAFMTGSSFGRRFSPRTALSCYSNSEGYHATFNPDGARNSNPVLDSTGGSTGTGGSGSLAIGWSAGQSATETGVTRTYSKVSGPNTGRPAQRIVLGGTTVENGQLSLLFQNLAGLTIGDTVRLVIEIDGWTGLSNIEALSAIINPNGGSFDGGVADMHYIDANDALRTTNASPIGNMPASVGPGLLLTPPFVLTSATPRILFAARALSALTVGGTIDVLNMGLMGA